MKVIRLLFLLLLVACSEDEGDVSPEEPEIVQEAILEYPHSNYRCTEGATVEGDKTEIEFLWNAGEHSTSFELVVVNLLTDQTQTFTTSEDFYLATLDTGTPYSWWVVSYNKKIVEGTKSQERKFYTSGEGITNYAPFPAELLTPSDQEEITTDEHILKLEWQAEDVDEEDLMFDIYFGKDRDFSEPLQKNLTDNFYQIEVEEKQTYFWKVIAKDPAGNVSESNISSFSVLEIEDADDSDENSEKEILSFSIENDGVTYVGEIDHQNKTIFLELDNFDYKTLTPEIEVSQAASLVPESGKSQNFLDDLYYKVIAEDGSQTVYDIVVLSGQHEILEFEVHHKGERYIGIVNSEDATVSIELGGEDFTAMKPYIRTSNRSTIDAPAGELKNFNEDVYYTVTSEKGTTKRFKVIAPIRLKQTFPFYGSSGYKFTSETRNERFVMYAGADLNFRAVNFPDPEKVKIELVSAAGTSYPLQITEHSYNHQTYLEVSNTEHLFKSIIPYSVPSGTYNYKIYDGIKQAIYEHKIEVINDHTTIKITGLSDDEFGFQDTMIITGENLPKSFAIYSRFNQYVFRDYRDNPVYSDDQTEVSLEFTQNVYGNLTGGETLKPMVFFTRLAGYEHPVVSNTVYFTLNGYND